ncbi:MAG TPA: peroxiredoxin family protein [Candidatus Dormibacteraeota bacterium]|jgi:peroxiredoxin|nr:peroxiredoxin family protein [Candidatus Dormibacteraeota bacterium]
MSDGKAPGVGDSAPDFTLKTIGLKDVSLKSFRGKNVLVLFYPLDWTPGCSTCMPAFDGRVRDFEAANTQLLGISTDSPFSHENWAKSVGISHCPLLSDIHRTTSRDYGVYWPDWNANVRATFLIDPQGTILFVERYGRGELPDPDKMLAEIKRLS